MDCVECIEGFDHCHGTLIGHMDAAAECTEPGCADLDPARHADTITCADLRGGCACTMAPAQVPVLVGLLSA